MNTRREFLAALGASAAFAGCKCPFCKREIKGQTALQLYSLHQYIGGIKDKDGKVKLQGVGLEKALADVAKIGYKGVEFAGYYGFKSAELKKMLADNGLAVAGTHVGNGAFGFDMKAFKYDPEVLKKTCEFETAYGNTYVCCPGGGNAPDMPNVWGAGRDCGKPIITMDAKAFDYVKRLVEFYNKAAADAAQMGVKIGLHNHMWEHGLVTPDGVSYWDYFFSNTDKNVCMEQDVGWSTCAGVDPCEQYEKYSHRSPTLHAKENGMGPKVTKFDAILGKPGEPGAKGVDWDALVDAAEDDGVKWWVVECEKHFEDLSAVTPSYAFLKSKGLN